MNDELKTIVQPCKDCGNDFTTVEVGNFRGLYCPLCVEQRIRIRNEREASDKRQKLIAEWYEVCPFDFRNGLEKDQTQIAKLPQKQYSEAMDWIMGKNKGMWFNGPPGRCKTRIMWLVMHKLWMAGHRVTALTAAQFSRYSSDAAAHGNAVEWADKMVNTKCLFIDDVGKGRMTELNDSDLYDILDRRIASGTSRPTFITSNMQLKQFAFTSNIRGEPLVRRLNLLEAITF